MSEQFAAPEQFTIRCINGTEVMNRPAYEDYQQRLNDRLAAGRYTLEEAALTIYDATGERADAMLKKLVQAASFGDLATYEPGKNARYVAEKVRDFYEEAYWSDLNVWLDAHEKRITWRFTDPSSTRPERAIAVARNTAAPDYDAKLAALFDPVSPAQLDAMFPDEKWNKYAERAARNELDKARQGLRIFNPYLAAQWWLKTAKPKPVGWDWSRCARKLANNLPARSLDSKHLLTGDFD